MYSIKPTYTCDAIKILKECPELLLIIDVVLNIVIHIYIYMYIDVVLCSSKHSILNMLVVH